MSKFNLINGSSAEQNVDAVVNAANMEENNQGRIGKCMKEYTDGIIDQEKFIKAPLKILWILKETNGKFNIKKTFGSDFDFAEYMKMVRCRNRKKGGKTKSNIKRTFGPVSKVSYSLLNDGESQVYCSDYRKLSKVMPYIAIMNVKQTPGKSSAKYNELVEASRKSMVELVDRIRNINPDVVIFGSTLNLMKNGLMLNQCRSDCSENIFAGKKQVFYFSDRVFIGAYHPNVRIKGLNQKKYVQEIFTSVGKWKSMKMEGKLTPYVFPEMETSIVMEK